MEAMGGNHMLASGRIMTRVDTLPSFVVQDYEQPTSSKCRHTYL
jgi:hypothetical protein